jgi:pectate lyase
MIIELTQELLVSSDKTIDGRGAQVHIANGGGITVQFARNVIIHNLHVHDVKHTAGGMMRDSPTHTGPRTKADGDGISLFGATNVWIDHISMSNCEDGLVDVVQSSTGVTISNCHFTNHNDVMLFGASDSYPQDQVMQITVAFNHFGRGLVQRMPRCRWGFFHVVNNDYTHWLMYAIGGSNAPTIISQGNRYIAPPNIAAKVVMAANSFSLLFPFSCYDDDTDRSSNNELFMCRSPSTTPTRACGRTGCGTRRTTSS